MNIHIGIDTDLILMDEPFSGLDYARKTALQDLVQEVFGAKTRVLVTHDPEEAAKLGDQIYLLDGKPAKPRLLANRAEQEPLGAALADVLLKDMTA